MNTVALGELLAEKVTGLDPSKHPSEEFELWSIPAFDVGKPQLVCGSEIGSSKKCVEPDDVLLSRIVPHIRRSWIVSQLNGHRKIASSEWIVFRSKHVVPEYLRHFLVSDPFHSQFMLTVAGVGGSLLRARPDGVAKIKIPLPPLDEQRRIAAILDQADTLRHKRREAIAKLGELRRSAFAHFFGDPSSNLKGWPTGRISDVTSSTQYGTSSKAGEVGEFPVLRMGNITSGGDWMLDDLKYIDLKVNDVGKYTVRTGDILFNRTNSPELVGKTAVFRENQHYAFAGYLVRLRLNDRAHPEYVSAYLNSAHGKATLRGMCKSIIGMANINAKELVSIPLMLPPMVTQEKFAEVVSASITAEKSNNNHLEQLDTLFASLQHRAFRGEL